MISYLVRMFSYQLQENGAAKGRPLKNVIHALDQTDANAIARKLRTNYDKYVRRECDVCVSFNAGDTRVVIPLSHLETFTRNVNEAFEEHLKPHPRPIRAVAVGDTPVIDDEIED